MSQAPPPLPSNSADNLQFDTAEPGAAAQSGEPARCSACGNALIDRYYVAGDQVICPNCRDAFVGPARGSRIGRLTRALIFGLIAGLGGALIWFAVRKFTGYEVGLIAIVVGLMVGGAVRAGSRGRGGAGYQVLAVLLTYFSICANYMPDIFMMLRDEYRQEDQSAGSAATQPTTAMAATTAPTSAPVEAAAAGISTPGGIDEKPGLGMMIVGVILLLILMFLFSLAAPFLGGASNIIGLLIIAFALWEAWKINKRQDANIAGPYAFGPGAAPAPGAPPGGA